MRLVKASTQPSASPLDLPPHPSIPAKAPEQGETVAAPGVSSGVLRPACFVMRVSLGASRQRPPVLWSFCWLLPLLPGLHVRLLLQLELALLLRPDRCRLSQSHSLSHSHRAFSQTCDQIV
eukprot:scaffold1635_cov203-Isochrysis_galbana.AAC.1